MYKRQQHHLALVLEQQKAVLVRQRFVGFDIADDVLLFLFSQSWLKVVSCFQSYHVSTNIYHYTIKLD